MYSDQYQLLYCDIIKEYYNHSLTSDKILQFSMESNNLVSNEKFKIILLLMKLKKN